MLKFSEWVKEWEEQYTEHKEHGVIKADIRMSFKAPNGEIHVIHSEYLAKHQDKVQVLHLPNRTAVNYICG